MSQITARNTGAQGASKTTNKAGEVMKPWTRLSVFVEYRLRPELTLRAEVFNLNDAAVPQTITYFTAPRPAPVLYADRRELGEGPVLFLRVRRTLN